MLRYIAIPARKLTSYARNQVRSILSQPPFRPRSLPRPFAGILHTISSWLHAIFAPPVHWTHDLFRHISISLGIPENDLWFILAAVTFAVAAGVTTLYIRRGARLGSEKLLPGKRHAGIPGNDPGKLRKMAQEAENRGDYAMAIRLRFSAGLATLEQMSIIHSQTVHTNNYISATIHSPTFSRLAQTFDEIVYGGMAASLYNAREADTGWATILQEAPPSDSNAQDDKIAVAYNGHNGHNHRYRHKDLTQYKNPPQYKAPPRNQ